MSQPRRTRPLWTKNSPALTPADFDAIAPEHKKSAITLLLNKQDRQIVTQQKTIHGLKATQIALAAEIAGLKKALRFAQSGIKLTTGQKQ